MLSRKPAQSCQGGSAAVRWLISILGGINIKAIKEFNKDELSELSSSSYFRRTHIVEEVAELCYRRADCREHCKTGINIG